jgi:hypothetical protein
MVAQACVKLERVHMVRDSFLRWPLAFHTLALAAILTVIGGAASLTIDQMLRGGANQPQIDMVNYYVGEIASGEEPADVRQVTSIWSTACNPS